MAYCALATVETLAFGAIQLSMVLDLILKKSFSGGLPFLPGAFLKLVAAASIYSLMAARRLLPPLRAAGTDCPRISYQFTRLT